MATTYEKIASVTVGSGGAATIEFTSIPATFDDLVLKLSLRDNGTVDADGTSNAYLRFNSITTNYSQRRIFGSGSVAASDSGTSGIAITYNNNNTGTGFSSSNFGNAEAYVPNYAGSTNKSVSVDMVQENNRSAAYSVLLAGLWSNTNAISSIQIVPGFYGGGTQFQQYSTATLYGIKKS